MLFGDNKFVINSDRLDEFLTSLGGVEYIEAAVKDTPNDKVRPLRDCREWYRLVLESGGGQY